MRLASLAIIGILIWPTMLTAQTYATRSSQSIILPGEPGWRNYVNVADGPCGCTSSVRTDRYDEYCPSCCYCSPLCILDKVGRMLDCLLPCNVCCGFGHGCVLGGGCGSCGSYPCASGCGRGCGGCCRSSWVANSSRSCCSTPSCTTSVLPEGPPVPPASDPFRDDPVQPGTSTSPTSKKRGTEIHWNPVLRTPTTAQKAPPPVRALEPVREIEPVREARTAPPKVTNPGATGLLPMLMVRAANPQAAPAAMIPTSEPVSQSVLVRTSHEGETKAPEPAPLPVVISPAPIQIKSLPAPPVEVSAAPILIKSVPAPLPKSVSAPAATDVEIPSNPLRP